MKYAGLLLNAVIVLVGWQGPTPQKAAPNQPQKNTNTHQNTPAQMTPVITSNPPNGNQTQSPDKTQNSNEESVRIISAPNISTESKKDFYDKALLVATWLLVAVGGFQILYLWRTVIATRDNAKAAFLNAQAIINSERPWIGIFATHSQGVYAFHAGNVGRTPADVISYSAKAIIADSKALPNEPEYGAETVPPLAFLIPGKELGDQTIKLESYNVNTLIANNLPHAALFSAGKEEIILLFRIFYRNTLSQRTLPAFPYETRMCFVWKANSSPEVGGPAGYNAYT